MPHIMQQQQPAALAALCDTLTDVDIAGSSISIAAVLRVVPGLISASEERQQEVMNFCPKTLFESARYCHLLQC